MPWILSALMIATVLCPSSVGSSNLTLIDQVGFNTYGRAGRVSMSATSIARSKNDVKVSVIASILNEYTDPKDAVKTALRYHNQTDDPELWAAMTIVESRCKTAAVSRSGAQGKLQVMPFWKKKPGFEFYRGRHSHLNDDLNFKAAYKVYCMLLGEQHGNKWRSVERYCGVGPDARAYVSKVKQLYHQIKTATTQAEMYEANQASPERVRERLVGALVQPAGSSLAILGGAAGPEAVGA